MPDYEFYCRRCQEPFSATMSVKEHDTRQVECPKCKKNDQVQKRISLDTVVTSKKS
jgi:putative FmdB family regulatory protein